MIDIKRYAEKEKDKSPANIKTMKKDNVSNILERGEAYIKKICDEITPFKPNLMITKKTRTPAGGWREGNKCQQRNGGPEDIGGQCHGRAGHPKL